EIESAYGGARPHREALGELDADATLAVEQAEQLALLGVVGLRRIARRRTDAAIFLGDEFHAAQALLRRIGPELRAPALGQPRRKGSGEPVGQRLDHDRRIVI